MDRVGWDVFKKSFLEAIAEGNRRFFELSQSPEIIEYFDEMRKASEYFPDKGRYKLNAA